MKWSFKPAVVYLFHALPKAGHIMLCLVQLEQTISLDGASCWIAFPGSECSCFRRGLFHLSLLVLLEYDILQEVCAENVLETKRTAISCNFAERSKPNWSNKQLFHYCFLNRICILLFVLVADASSTKTSKPAEKKPKKPKTTLPPVLPTESKWHDFDRFLSSGKKRVLWGSVVIPFCLPAEHQKLVLFLWPLHIKSCEMRFCLVGMLQLWVQI